MGKIAYIFFLLIASCSDTYQEYKAETLPDEMNTVYLKDSLRYLSLTVAEKNVINATFEDQTIATPIILNFPTQGIRVLIIKDRTHFTQIVNIAPLYNATDIYKAHDLKLVQTNLFTFPVNAYFYKIYKGIRKELIRNLEKHYTIRINTLGSASTYGLMLGIELSALEIPLESIVSFGPARFTTQEAHDQIKQSFGNRLINITHEEDVAHKIYMGKSHAQNVTGEYLVCQNKTCEDSIYTLENISHEKLARHISNFPHSYAQMYHDSILYMEEDEHRRENGL